MARLTRLSLWIVLSAVATVIACGGGNRTASRDSDLGRDLPMQEVLDVQHTPEEVGERDRSEEEEVPPVVENRYEIILLFDNTEPIKLLPSDTLKVRAMVRDYAQDAPGAGLDLHYAFIKVEDLSGNPSASFDGSFEVEDVGTDADGYALNYFRTCLECEVIEPGKGCDLKYTIEISLPDADPDAPPLAEAKTFEVVVPCKECGCSTISLSNEAGLTMGDLADIDIYVLPNDYACDNLSPDKGVPPNVIADRSISDILGTTSFECLDGDSYYTFYALGHRPGSPCVVASGCNDGVFLKPGVCKDYKLKMYLATMNPTGVYDCIDHFDFTNVIKECAGDVSSPVDCVTSVGDIGKTVCCALNEAIRLFKDPGQTIINSIFDLAKLWIGSIIIDTIENALGILKDAIAKIITDYLKDNGPPLLKDFFTIGEDMMGVVTNLEMLSTLTLSKVQSNLTMNGSQYWTGLALYWKIGCDPQAPDYEQCGRIPLDLKNINDPNFPLNLLSGTYTARLEPFDRFVMNQHEIKLNYGKLVLYVIEDIFIKWATGGKAHSILDAAKLWIDCTGIANGIIGDIVEIFKGDKQDVIDVCDGAVKFIFGFANQFLGALTLDTEMMVSGMGTFVDIPPTVGPGETPECDLRADKITNGKYEGTIQGGQVQAVIKGKFECVIQ